MIEAHPKQDVHFNLFSEGWGNPEGGEPVSGLLGEEGAGHRRGHGHRPGHRRRARPPGRRGGRPLRPLRAGGGETVSRIEELGGKAATIQGDLSNVAECERTVDAAAEALSAGSTPWSTTPVSPRRADFLDTDEETYDSGLRPEHEGLLLPPPGRPCRS